MYISFILELIYKYIVNITLDIIILKLKLVLYTMKLDSPLLKVLPQCKFPAKCVHLSVEPIEKYSTHVHANFYIRK